MNAPLTLETVIARHLQTATGAHFVALAECQVSFKTNADAAAFAVSLHDVLKGAYEVQLNLPKTGDGKPYVSWLPAAPRLNLATPAARR